MDKEDLQRLYLYASKDSRNKFWEIIESLTTCGAEILFEDDDKIDVRINWDIISFMKVANKRISHYLSDITEYAHNLLAEGDTKEVRGYLIGYNMNPLLSSDNFIEQDGYWFKTTPLFDATDNRLLGELYVEIITDFKSKNK